ncbi:HET-domain-containing protein, partial [Tothia fuscella]
MSVLDRHRRRVQLSTGSWQTLNDIHYWLRECEGAHSRCAIRQWELTRQLPTRLLEVGSFNTDPTVYLRSSTQISPDAKYATLSHCWGNNMPVRLTQDTLPAFYEGIHVAILPRTFRDAIVLTRALGLNYLWIDTLCIIQGPTGDWAAECALMSSVYRGSFVNIGANASTDSHGGLFCQRSWKSVTPLTGRLTYTPIGWHENPVVLYPHGGANILDRAPLGSRAWVAQERLLSPRTVHFLPHKVVWECDECFASESDVTGSLEGTPYINRRCLARPVSTHGNNTYTGDQFLATWDRIIRFYSGGQLTVATDKLVAISGVARYMQSTLWGDGPVSYHAGHWSYRFELQLTWYPSAFSVGSRAQTYVAPSWSWASYNGEVFM